ncbi:MAG: beta strand repeat-containing protein [Limisphaerales bacterium]
MKTPFLRTAALLPLFAALLVLPGPARAVTTLTPYELTFDGMTTTNVVTTNDLNAAASGATWTINYARGIDTVAISDDAAGTSDKAFTCDDVSGNNSGALEFYRVVLDQPIALDPATTVTVNFRFLPTRSGNNKGLRFILEDSAGGAVGNLYWQDSTSGVGPNDPVQLNNTTIGNSVFFNSTTWNSTNISVRSVTFTITSTTLAVDFVGPTNTVSGSASHSATNLGRLRVVSGGSDTVNRGLHLADLKFTRTVSAPNPVSSGASPADFATGVAVALPSLAWDPPTLDATHDAPTNYLVYFGTNPTVTANPSYPTTTNSLPTPGLPLAASTTYYWRVDAQNEDGTTPGTLWQFTTLGASVPDIDVTSPLTFGETARERTNTLNLAVNNLGTGPLTITNVQLTAGDTTQFAVASWPATVAAGAASNIVVRYQPTTAGPHSATLSISSDDPDEGTVNVTLNGTCVPQIRWTPGNGDWDFFTTNWMTLGGGGTYAYADGDHVTFNDAASGTSPITVTLTGSVNPASVTVSNQTKDYVFAGLYNLYGSAPLRKQGAAKLTVATDNNNTGGTTISGGTLQLGDGGFTGSLTGAITNDGQLVIHRADDITLGNTVRGTGSVLKQGGNTVTLGAANTFSGGATIEAGTLKLANVATPLGANGNTITIQSGASLDFNGTQMGSVATRGYRYVVGGSGPDGNGAMINSSANNVFAFANVSNLVLTANTVVGGNGGRWDIGNGGNTNGLFDGQGYSLTATGSLLFKIRMATITNVARIIVANNQLTYEDFDHTGPTTANLTNEVQAGKTLLARGNRTLNFPLELDGATLANEGGVGVPTWTGPVLLKSTSVFSSAGSNQVIAGPISGPGGLTVTNGNFTVILNGNNTYTGETTVSQGRLRVNGTLAAASTVTVAARGFLEGTGTIGGAVTNFGTLSPGSGGIGTLTISGPLTLDASSTNTFEVNGSGPANDKVVLGSTVSYGGQLNIVTNGTFTPGQKFTLFSGAGATNTGNFASLVGSPGPGLFFTFTNGVLSVGSTGPSEPAVLTNSVSGSTLSLSWPAGQGWRLEWQTNTLATGLGTNWLPAADSSVSSTNITLDPTKPAVFYRLAYP